MRRGLVPRDPSSLLVGQRRRRGHDRSRRRARRLVLRGDGRHGGRGSEVLQRAERFGGGRSDQRAGPSRGRGQTSGLSHGRLGGSGGETELLGRLPYGRGGRRRRGGEERYPCRGREGAGAGEEAGEDAIEGDEDLKDLSVDQFKDMIRDIISQEVGGDAAADDMDAGDIEGMGDEAPVEEPEMEDGEEEIDLDELIRELDGVSEEEKVSEEEVSEETSNQVEAQSDGKSYNINRVADLKEDKAENSELDQALETIETLKKELNEVNILNSKLLYVNKIFKSNTLSESQKVNVIAAFDKAETVKEVKLVFETVADNIGTKKVSKKESIKEHKGSASKATGTTASKPEVIAEVSDAVRRMQKLAGII